MPKTSHSSNPLHTDNSSPLPSPSPRDIEFLFEVGSLRYVARSWRQFLSPMVQNTTEHTVRVAWLAMLIAKYEHSATYEHDENNSEDGRKKHQVSGGGTQTQIDLGKIALMALVHDVTESRNGDVHYISRQYTKRDEHLAAQDIFAGTALRDDMLALLNEYEQRQSLEAKIVKDADNLDCDIELKELATNGSELGAAFKKPRRRVFETQLFTATARKIWQALQKADPHAWHINGRNRLKAGDWRK